jgi:hypothetical protein
MQEATQVGSSNAPVVARTTEEVVSLDSIVVEEHLDQLRIQDPNLVVNLLRQDIQMEVHLY